MATLFFLINTAYCVAAAFSATQGKWLETQVYIVGALGTAALSAALL